MKNQPLFDVTRTTTARCPICKATRTPEQKTTAECAVDQDRTNGRYPRRPAGCLNAVDPATTEIPY